MEDRYCRVCNLERDEDIGFHNATAQHRFNFLLYEWNHYKKALVKNRHGVEVNIQPRHVNGFRYNYDVKERKGKHSLKITPDQLTSQSNQLEFVCTVENKRTTSIIITSAVLLHPYELWSLYDPLNNLPTRYVKLEPRAPSYQIIVRYKVKSPVIGSYKIPVSFNFQTVEENADTFTIARALIVSIEEISPEEEATASSPFTSNDWPANIEIFPPTQNPRQMNMYPIPVDWIEFLKSGLNYIGNMSGAMCDELAKVKRQLHPDHVTLANYRMFWHIMLWMEEVAQMLMLKKYNMENVKMTLIGGERLELEVPGLAEKRPSVIVGDMIDIRVHEDHRGYRGVIKAVNDKTVYIDYVDPELVNYISTYPKIELDVRFVLGRLPYERMHQGVDQTVINGVVPSLFPDYSLSRKTRTNLKTIYDSEFFNSNIAINREQKIAVVNIFNNTSMQAPYIVFGPPGTGKTVTIVEAILQIKKRTDKKILVCAPANAACDMLTEKLMMHCRKDELIRIMSDSVDKQNLNPHILEYSNFQDGQFQRIMAEEVSKYRIVVTTLILIGRYNRKYHPEVVFIDEAAQPCEPEACCALGMIEKGKQIILAGDPKQLGPVLSSRVSETYGLGISMLERLMNMELYRSRDQNFITMLKQNFRSHSTILTLPNELFYDNELRAVSVKSQNDPLAKVFVFNAIQGLVKKKKVKVRHPGQAIEFCSVISKECREGRSPSYFNQKEMQMVLKYVQALLQLHFENEEDKVLPEQIGVVTPYIRQVYKIRGLLKHVQIEGVEVGTTETFQGREKRVIIISTVRANDNLLAYDRKYNLGFVRHDKRFNVALTRAMSKLIVIGCAHVLDTDTKWSMYIQLCERLYAFCGAPYAKRTQEVIEEILRRMENVHMLDAQHNH